ncbi:type II toxin-antitoxin system VapC family toxin [Rhizobium sp. RCC_161_2]|uniref:type II toxin-antitoxin system VapC family toxin n=1 Tax=Rhizobium sp. RCC_161_2 TaxID=3239219 RepID=UPI003523B514
MYLLDTNIISATSPLRAQDLLSQATRAWVAAHADQFFLSTVTVAEIETGIAKAHRTGASKKASLLGEWLELTVHLYGERILSFDTATARIAGRLFDQAVGRGGDPGFEDAAIAATALRHDCTVLTRNLRHFRLMDVRSLDPFANPPEL